MWVKTVKIDNFHMKKGDISPQNINFGYMLEPPLLFTI